MQIIVATNFVGISKVINKGGDNVDLWSDEIKLTPYKIVEEQAEILTSKTKGKVAAIVQYFNDQKRTKATMYLYSIDYPWLKYPLIQIRSRISNEYPVLITNEDFEQEVDDEESLIIVLKKIFRSTETKVRLNTLAEFVIPLSKGLDNA